MGSFLIGFFATLTTPEGMLPVGASGRHFFMTGLMGGFTTFSAFSLQTLNLARDHKWLLAGASATGNLILCLAAVGVGHLAALALAGRR